jgi:hypothetical protein
MQPEQILDFIRAALSAEPDKNKLVEEYWDLLNGKFAEFIREEEAHKDDAAMLKKMQETGKKFEEIARFNSIKGKMIGAVGGGFSSGKSAFINSLMSNTSVQLKTDMKPTTAIPAYVSCNNGGEPSITGYSSVGNGAKFEISPEIFESIDHEFLKELKFNLKSIIPYITVSCPLKEGYFEKICLIDTPGYDPAGTGFSSEDYETAVQHIGTADFLIWIINIKNNGTIPDSDLTVLKQLDKDRQLNDLYIVANQADRRTEYEINDILENIMDTLDNAGIRYEGICAYASGGLKQGAIFQTHGQDLYDFFKSHNFQSHAYMDIEKAINDVFDDYKEKIEKQKKKFITNLKLLDQIDIKQAGLDPNSDASDLKIIRKYFSIGNIERHLKKCEELRREFMQIIGRLDSVEKYAHIKTIPQLIKYFEIIRKKTQEDNPGKTSKLLDSLEALVLSLNIIYTRDFSVSIFKQIIEKSPLFMSEIGSWVANAIAAEIRYINGNSIDAEKLLKEICKEIIDIAERVMNDYAGEKATFSYESINSDILGQGFFTKHEYSKEELEKIGFEILSLGG